MNSTKTTLSLEELRIKRESFAIEFHLLNDLFADPDMDKDLVHERLTVVIETLVKLNKQIDSLENGLPIKRPRTFWKNLFKQ